MKANRQEAMVFFSLFHLKNDVLYLTITDLMQFVLSDDVIGHEYGGQQP